MGVQIAKRLTTSTHSQTQNSLVKWADSNRQLSPIIAHKRILARVALRHLVHCRDNNTHDNPSAITHLSSVNRKFCFSLCIGISHNNPHGD